MNLPEVDLEQARVSIKAESDAIAAIVEYMDESFTDAARTIFACSGKVVLTGIGKAGIIAQKISATLASTGTQSIFLHPVEALHGDLGRLDRNDVVLALSHSGATEEIVRLMDHVKARGAKLIALTGLDESPLVRYADIVVRYGNVQEACPLGLAPTVSTTCMLALGDAIALAVMRMRSFKPEDFAAFHPGGSLGRKLLKVEEVMTFKKGSDSLCIVPNDITFAQALAEAETGKRRTGAILLIDADEKLCGVLTDGDIRRALIDRGGEKFLDMPVAEFMTADPQKIRKGELASEALAILNKFRISELPVVDEHDRPIGVIEIKDLLGIKTVSENGD